MIRSLCWKHISFEGDICGMQQTGWPTSIARTSCIETLSPRISVCIGNQVAGMSLKCATLGSRSPSRAKKKHSRCATHDDNAYFTLSKTDSSNEFNIKYEQQNERIAIIALIPLASERTHKEHLLLQAPKHLKPTSQGLSPFMTLLAYGAIR